MTAPAAPTIHVKTHDNSIYVRWQPVDGATDYNLYVDNTPNPTSLEAEIADDDIYGDGWFAYVTEPTWAGVTYIRLTALNALAEESGYSNEVQRNLRGHDHDVEPTPALDHVRKGAGL